MMKHTHTLVALALAASIAACQKPHKQVTYNATGTRASIAYVDGNEVWQRAGVFGPEEYHVLQLDTIIDGLDTTLTVIDTVQIPVSWSCTFDAPHDGTARFVITQEFGAREPASGTLQIDGVTVASGTVTHYRDKVTLIP